MGTETPKTDGDREFEALIDKAYYEIHAPGRSVTYYFAGEALKPIRVILKELVKATRERERAFYPPVVPDLRAEIRNEAVKLMHGALGWTGPGVAPRSRMECDIYNIITDAVWRSWMFSK